ncbi:S-layer family protein [Kovacikia minuta CCNUW1]|uniref:two-partner secretion domain-containing protein n=1 Tax=Kovacikia minuta TaxID=2931930 RepID=UPI001CCF4383|nr:filamentous hemagglutinin N-terminal domain-containing protein [Kovacikia minuta]UBF29120.1 S-layer family protein [Kovacikia minuta CCNUW1]
MNRSAQSAAPKEPHLKAWVLTGSIVSGLLCAQPIAAQVIPDATLPVGERSQVTGNPNLQIDGGARRGGNLFHSFSQFSVPTGGSAYFNNAADVQNIFSRVTGGSISNIDGLIRANGTANLFLLNPNGILFGPNASLNIGGSFVATTANAIGFSNGEKFSSDATQPLPSQLLSVNPNAFFFNQLTPQPIIVQSRFDERVFTGSSFNATGLHVPPGKNLLLVGGPIQLESGEPFISANPPGRPLLVFSTPGIQDVQPDGGWLISPGSYVELGAVGGIGTVGLSMVNSDWQLTIPNAVSRANISLSNGSGIYVMGASGSIRMLAQNIDISKSELATGIPRDSRLPNTETGDFDLNATGSITLSMSIWENNLAGQGTLGSINLTAGDRVSLDRAVVYGGIGSTGIGNVGDINITTGSLSVTNRSSVQFYTDGQGSTGNINVNAHDTVSFDDFGSVYNTVRQNGVGNAGNINITTRSLLLSNNTELASFTTGRGNASNINIDARDTVSFTRNSSLLSYTFGQGNAGSINMNAANTISLDQHSNVFNFVFGGNSGGINITTGSLFLTNGSSMYTNTFGQGNAGSVKINARDRVSLDGEYTTTVTIGGRIVPLGYNTSTIYTTVNAGAVGQGGDVSISTGSLFLTNGGVVNTSTEGRGNAGRVFINARDSVQISGTAPTRPGFRSEVLTSTQPTAVGNAGAIDITARSLSVLNNAQLSASTAGDGKAGNIIISAETFDIQNQAEVTVSSVSSGLAGNLFVDADRVFLNHQGSIRADTSGGGGNIDLRSPFILLRNGSNITTNATGVNIPGGNITIDTRFLIAVLSENSNISANSEDFRGGNVRINAFSIFGIQPRLVSTPLSDITATGATSTLSGTINVITSGLDPTSGLVALPTDLADSSRLITQGCAANQGNSFVITGRGGIPPTPEQQLDDDAEWSDRRRLVVGQQANKKGVRSQEPGARINSTLSTQHSALSTFPHPPHPTPYTPTPIVEATGWRRTPSGEVFLVADSSSPSQTTYPSCVGYGVRR